MSCVAKTRLIVLVHMTQERKARLCLFTLHGDKPSSGSWLAAASGGSRNDHPICKGIDFSVCKPKRQLPRRTQALAWQWEACLVLNYAEVDSITSHAPTDRQTNAHATSKLKLRVSTLHANIDAFESKCHETHQVQQGTILAPAELQWRCESCNLQIMSGST